MRMRIVLVLLAALTVLLVTTLAWLYQSRAELQALKRQAGESLSLKSSNVIAEIERYRYLPFVLGQDERIQRLLETGSDQDRVDAANKYFETANRSAGSDVLYAMDAAGTTLASSNWNEPTSFVGQQYGFRPYFKDALERGEGHYYAVGVTTGVPGYFLSRRIETAMQKVGVVVAKVDLSDLEGTWRTAGEYV